LSREGDPIPWVVQVDGEEGCGLGIVVGVIIDYEPRNWVVRREIRANHRKSVHPCGFIASTRGWPLLQRELVQQGAYGWVEMSLFCNQLVDNSKQISVHKCICELC
jgi:hypothetical protein